MVSSVLVAPSLLILSLVASAFASLDPEPISRYYSSHASANSPRRGYSARSLSSRPSWAYTPSWNSAPVRKSTLLSDSPPSWAHNPSLVLDSPARRPPRRLNTPPSWPADSSSNPAPLGYSTSLLNSPPSRPSNPSLDSLPARRPITRLNYTRPLNSTQSTNSVQLCENYGKDVSKRIIGGSKSEIEDFPYQLSMEGAPNGQHICGATIIHRHWALTAAHCVYDKSVSTLALREGSSTKGSGGTLHKVSFYLSPPEYRRRNLDYDVALVRVKTPFIIGPKKNPVVLPARLPKHCEPAVIAGWGFIDKHQTQKPKHLMSADVNVLSWDVCKKIYPALTPRMMCAWSSKAGFCSGDSGGPLIMGEREQVGIVSWLYECGDGRPGVYTNVSSVTNWIVKSLKKYKDRPEFGPRQIEFADD